MNVAAFIDVAVFFGFLIAVLIIAFIMGRRDKKKTATATEDYFLAGRGLAWWIIGISLISANISAEQFVGMPGQAATKIGLAIASYEWLAAVSLVIVAFVFLPRFLRAGVYTIPQFLETRYSKTARILMSLSLLFIYAFVTIVAVNYAGAKYFSDIFDKPENVFFGMHLNLVTFSWILGFFAAVYVIYGGLKSAAWAGSLQGTALILCGVVVLFFAMQQLGKVDRSVLEEAVVALDTDFSKKGFSDEELLGMCAKAKDLNTEELPGMLEGLYQNAKELNKERFLDKLEKAGAYERFTTVNESRLRMNLPWNDRILPVTALLFALWIPNLFYWGCDQHIMQRTLGSRSLSQGQKGIMLAAILKLIIPFIVIFPGIIAFNLYHAEMKHRAFEGKAITSTDEAGNIIVIKSAFEVLKEEREKYTQLFDFDDKFAVFHPEEAWKMVEFNAAQVNKHHKTTLDYTALRQAKSSDPLNALEELKQQYPKHLFTFDSLLNPPPYSKPGKLVSGYDYDSAFALVSSNLVPKGGLYGFALAALFGMVVSALAAMLNAVSTLFTMDIYKGIRGKASDKELVFIGRISIIGFVIIGCCIVPIIADPRFGGVFTFIQEFQGFVSPGILCAFMFGFFVHKAPRCSGIVSLLMSPAVYGLLMWFRPHTAFLDRMGLTFTSIVIVLVWLRWLFPMKEAFKLETNTTMDLRGSRSALFFGFVVVVLTVILYIHFWDHTTPMFDGFCESFVK